MKSKKKATKKASRPTNFSHKNRDNLLLVSTHPPFIEKVDKIRGRLGIPSEGFKEERAVALWHKRKATESDEIMDSSEFQKKLRSIGTRFREKKISKKEADQESKELHLLLPFNFLTHSIKELAKEFGLLESYHEALRYYIYRNEFFFVPVGSYTVEPWDQGDRITEARYVPLRIYAKLTDEDLKNIKEEVNKFFGEKLPFVQNVRGLEKRLEIEKLREEGVEFDVISGKSYKLSDEEIAERVLGSRKKKPQIYEFVRGLKTLRERRFKKTEKQ